MRDYYVTQNICVICVCSKLFTATVRNNTSILIILIEVK
jgi:hypothetical protein